MISLEQVWAAAEAVARDRRKAATAAMEEWGLFLEMPPKRWEYFCTPHNSLTFGSTGGDGVHYGLLQLPGLHSYEQPVVMTVPMADRHNVVVAEHLAEFLNLGFHVGWFSLEQIVYAPEEAVAYHATPDPEDWPEHREDLVVFRDRLALRHQALSLERIAELESRYQHLVNADEEPQDEE